MGRLEALEGKLTAFIQDWRRNAREKSQEAVARVLRPRSFEKWTNGPVDRIMQVIALFLLPFVIVISFAIIVALNQTMSEIFGLSTFQDPAQQGIAGWFVTGITAGLFLLAAWSWFQFVRTYAFGLFRWNQ